MSHTLNPFKINFLLYKNVNVGIKLDEHDSDLEAQRVFDAHWDKGLSDSKIQTAVQGASGIGVCGGVN